CGVPVSMASAVALSTPHPVITQVFNQNRDLDSTGQDSADDKFWWINEGDMKIQDKLGHVQADKFRALALYEIKDNQNYIAQMYFKYNKYDGSGGTDSIGFLYNYHDGENKYSTGIRADGYSEIKEKNDGGYSDNHNPKKIYRASGNDGGDSNNEIPTDKWIGLRINVNQDKGYNNIKIYVNNGNGWEYVTEWTDDEDMMNGGLVGIRTDGYDVEFRDFEVIDVGRSI
ncbi:MAG: hypothetical protein WAQ29_00175, partial [Nitrososphaeraceae archaeon]